MFSEGKNATRVKTTHSQNAKIMGKGYLFYVIFQNSRHLDPSKNYEKTSHVYIQGKQRITVN